MGSLEGWFKPLVFDSYNLGSIPALGTFSDKKKISNDPRFLQKSNPTSECNIPQREQLFLNGILDLKLAEFPLKMIFVKDAQKFQRTDENVQKITDLIKENPRTTLLELEQDTGISKTTIGRITPAKFIPRFLTNEQKLCRLANCEDILEMTRTDPEWKDKIITGYETWHQSAEWRCQGELRPKKSRLLKSRNKVLLVAFLDKKGIFHHEYLPAGQTVIKDMYLAILRRLREAIRKNGQKNGLMVAGSYTMTMLALTQRT
ncbi:hypothetical protein LAZ67_1007951 [Cordylochernes scorpioides]|uniref:Transposase n=1 Tax=Cordylochernes scorpioides TaxID=51811 RepID=A0ABY6JZW7_9ARAC|nr:hypothetical protein LAZ67_1007951 [Cordylochernes scorpioides]